MRSSKILPLACLSTLVATGCGDYTWTLNERVMYEPTALFSNFKVEDDALHTCLAQAISDHDIRQPDQLDVLVCSNAGISSIAGIELFRRLRRIRFDSNHIVDTAPLSLLPGLEVLHLRDNRLQTVGPLICASALRQIALQGNPQLDCRDLKYLADCGIELIDQPSHCTAAP